MKEEFYALLLLLYSRQKLIQSQGEEEIKKLFYFIKTHCCLCVYI